MNQQTQPTDLLQDETLAQKLIKKGFWLYLFSYLIAPGGYLIRLMISNSAEVSVADVGVLYSIIGLINFLNVYNDLGLTESLQYFLPKFWIQKKFNAIKTTIWLSLCIQLLSSFLIIFGLWFGADWLGNAYFHSEKAAEILKYFCRYFLGINLLQSLQSIFIAFQKTFDHQFVEFIKTWATAGFTAFFFFFGGGNIERFSLVWIIGVGIGLMVAGFLYRKNYRSDLMQGRFERNKPMLKEYTQYALWAFVGANVGSLFGLVIQQMVIYFLGAEAAGYYANFLSLFLIGNILISPIMGLIFPMVSELIEKKDQKKLGLLFSFFYSYFSVLILCISSIFIVWGPEMAIALFGAKYVLSGQLLSLTGIFLIFNILTGFNFAVLAGLGKIKERVRILAFSTLITIIVTFGAMQGFGLEGAGIGFGVSYLALWGLSFPHVVKASSFSLQWKFMLKNLLILLFLSGVLYFFKEHLGLISEKRWLMFAKLIGICIVYALCFARANWKQVFLLKTEIRKIKVDSVH